MATWKKNKALRKKFYVNKVYFTRRAENILQVPPAFPSFLLHHVAFRRDLYWYLFLPTERNPEGDFCFYEKSHYHTNIGLS